MPTRTAVSLLVLAGLLTGCASARQVTFKTIPPAATVSVNGQVIGQTPVSTTLSCDQHPIVRFDRPGYVSFEQEIPTHQEFNGSNPIITWIETQCVSEVFVPLQAESVIGGSK